MAADPVPAVAGMRAFTNVLKKAFIKRLNTINVPYDTQIPHL
jgi:hypothetical protein